MTGDMGREVTDGPGAGVEFPVPGREFAILEFVDTVDPDPEGIKLGREG